jgi:protein TonB
LSYANSDPGGTLTERIRDGLGRRTTGFVAALLIEVLLLLLMLTLSQTKEQPKPEGTIVTAFDASEAPEKAPEPPRDEQQEPKPQPVPQPAEPQPLPPQPMPSPPIRIPLPRNTVPFDLANTPQPPAPPAANTPAYGPTNTGYPGDSKRVGTAPNGQPLYGAQWYREPSDEMMGDYLSTAQGPGWAVIACRTVPEFRVEDCVEVGEYPQNSHIAQAVLAAAWEFRVRPPRLGGRNMYGGWVRIRIDYELRKKREY